MSQAIEEQTAVIPGTIQSICDYNRRVRILFAEFETGRKDLIAAGIPSAADTLMYINKPKDLNEMLHELNSNQQRNIVVYASKHLAPGESRLNIADSDIRPELMADEKSPLSWQPELLWRFLASKYSPKNASEAISKEAANLFVEVFRLDDRDPTVFKGGVAFQMYACLEDFAKKWDNANHYTYQTRDRIEKICRAFKVWMEVFNKEVEDRFTDYSTFDNMKETWSRSPTNLDLGGKILFAPGIYVIPRKKCIEFRLTPDLVDNLNTFVGMHRTPPRNAE